MGRHWAMARGLVASRAMAETAAHPIEVRRLAESRELRLVWSDGHQAEYPYDYVRGYCPCAGCQGHTPSEIRYKPPASTVEPWRIEPVGNYGIPLCSVPLCVTRNR